MWKGVKGQCSTERGACSVTGGCKAWGLGCVSAFCRNGGKSRRLREIQHGDGGAGFLGQVDRHVSHHRYAQGPVMKTTLLPGTTLRVSRLGFGTASLRSEEHTSELQ